MRKEQILGSRPVILWFTLGLLIVFAYVFSNFNNLGITGKAVYSGSAYTWEEVTQRCDELCALAMELKTPEEKLNSDYCTKYFYIRDKENTRYYCDYHIGENLNVEEPYSNVKDDCYLGKYMVDDLSTVDKNEAVLGIECTLNP